MPITPRYHLSQSNTHLEIEVNIPHVRVSTSSLELVIVDGTDLHFYAPPTYLLKLILPGGVLDEEAVENSLTGGTVGIGFSENQTEKSHDDGSSGRPGGNAILIQEIGNDGNSTDNNKSETRVPYDAAVMTESSECMNSTTSNSVKKLWTKADLPKMQYDPERNHGTLIIKLRKEQDGFWPDLDLLGRLQQPFVKKTQQQSKPFNTLARDSKPLVQVIDQTGDEYVGEGDRYDRTDYDDAALATPMEELLSVNLQHTPTYGLFRNFSNVFRDYAREGLAHEMLECPSPDDTVTSTNNGDDHHGKDHDQMKRIQRIQTENGKFDADRYLADLYINEEGDMIFDTAMEMVPHWLVNGEQENTSDVMQKDGFSEVITITSKLENLSTADKSINANSSNNMTQSDKTNQGSFFTSEESHQLANIPPSSNIHHQLTPEQHRSAKLSLLDLLFSYVYDHRTTDGDPTVESSWTIMILSPSLSWLENYQPPYDDIPDVLRWCIRRSLIYPYVRSYDLAIRVVRDVSIILMKGRRVVIRCLLQLRKIMEKSEAHYLFNKLYVDPLIGWVQKIEEEDVQNFGKEVESILAGTQEGGEEECTETFLLDKQFLDLGLVVLEKSMLVSSSEEGQEEETEEGDYEVDQNSYSSSGYSSPEDGDGNDE
ncbi:hypothetical protein ACHAXS_005774 [Conticribra weissflogii]